MATPIESSLQALRRQAEAKVGSAQALALADTGDLSLETMRKMLHELQVHQIELEMQNDELRQAQVEIDTGRARYFDLYDLAPVGYCTVSELGIILEANFTAAILLGLVRSDLINTPVSRWIVKSDQDIYYRCRKVLFEVGAPQDCELQMLKRDGTAIWVRLSVSFAHDSAGAPMLRMVLSDISEHKRLDAVLQVKNRELEAARAAADRASKAKSDFLANMTHELRSPLNSILGFAQLMDQGMPEPTPSQKSSIGQILRAGWYLLDLVGEILDLTAIESGQLALVLAPTALADVLLDCEAMMLAQAQKRGIRMQFEPLAPPLLVLADPMRLKQVLVNLLSNAIKYNRVGGHLDVRCSRAAGERLRISVRDTGEGLSAEKITHLFQPFNRLGQETRSEEGTGIGLAVSKRLVELMGGGIGAESTVGVGSVFWIELKLAGNPEEDTP